MHIYFQSIDAVKINYLCIYISFFSFVKKVIIYLADSIMAGR